MARVTNRDKIVEYLREHPDGASDSEISRATGVTPVNQVNQICNRLAAEGSVSRSQGPKRSPIINRWLGEPGPAAEPSTGALPPDNFFSDTSNETVGLVLLDYRNAPGFVFEGGLGLTGHHVAAVGRMALEEQGWDVTVRLDQMGGRLLDARSTTDRLIVAATGELLGPEQDEEQQRHDYFLTLGELLQYMSTAEAAYGLALPARRSFMNLAADLPHWIRRQLGLFFLFVRPVESGFEVGLLPPEAVFAQWPGLGEGGGHNGNGG